MKQILFCRLLLLFRKYIAFSGANEHAKSVGFGWLAVVFSPRFG